MAPGRPNHKAAEGKAENQLSLPDRIFMELRSSSPMLSLELGGDMNRGDQHNGVYLWITSLTPHPWGTSSPSPWKSSGLTICCWISCSSFHICCLHLVGMLTSSHRGVLPWPTFGSWRSWRQTRNLKANIEQPNPSGPSACSMPWPWLCLASWWWWVPYIPFVGTCL